MPPTDTALPLFRSFWMAGFECSDKLNRYGTRIDLLAATGHLDLLHADYRLIKSQGMHTVREGIRWSFVEKRPYEYNFDVVKTMIEAAQQEGIQQLWDICHFGYPDDLSPLHPHFTSRFAALCRAFAHFYKSLMPDTPLIVTPINEVGFISWLGGEDAGTTPYCRNMGWQVKYELMKAYIKGIEALREVDPQVRILTTEPIVNIVPPANASPEQCLEAQKQHEYQYQSLDMLSGRLCPELGGNPENLDLLGFNFYYNNQWVCGFEEFLPWANLEPDERWRGLSSLLDEAYRRYERPLIIAETSHSGIDRPNWIDFITTESIKAIDAGVPLKGICIYPVIDRPDWDDDQNWHHSGLWDASADEPHARMVHTPYADALLKCRQRLS